MKKYKIALSTIFLAALTSICNITPISVAHAASANSITRSQAEQRALGMTNLTWTYSSLKNGNIPLNQSQYITQPAQLKNVTTAQMTGIPYNWGGQDGLNSYSIGASWTNFVDAINQGAYAGNVNTDGGRGYIPGTAGIDCSGFVQATFNIIDYKISTSTIFDKYFTKINISDLKHMDILDHPGDHVVVFDRWGTLNGISGAYTYESTPDQTFGGIQGTKKYFISLNEINKGYIAGRYVNIIDDNNSGSFAKVTNVNYAANFRLNPSLTSTIIGAIPVNTIVYLLNYNSGWYQVNYNGTTGWISGSLINPIQSGKFVTLTNAYQLNIRTATSTTSTILGTLSQNQAAQALATSSDGEWTYISVNGVSGWAGSSYLAPIN